MTSSATQTHFVGPEHTALAVGSGDLEVLGTPVLVAWLEGTTCAALDLDDQSTSVGTRIDIEHLAAGHVGATITTQAQVRSQDGRMVEFEVVAHDERGIKVAFGTVRRVIVDRERFLSRLHDVKN